MSFVEFLMKYYIWIIVVLIIAIVTVIGFLADARSKKKKMKGAVSGIENENANTTATTDVGVAPQPVESQSIVSQPSQQSEMSDISMPVGDLVLNSGPSQETSVGVTPEVANMAPVMPVQETPVGVNDTSSANVNVGQSLGGFNSFVNNDNNI